MLSFEKKRKKHSYLTVINMKTFDCRLIALQKNWRNLLCCYFKKIYFSVILNCWDWILVSVVLEMRLLEADHFENFLLAYEQFKLQVRSMKASSLHGIVRPPSGWSNPNSSSAWLSKFWNEGCFKYEIGITNLFFWVSPT